MATATCFFPSDGPTKVACASQGGTLLDNFTELSANARVETDMQTKRVAQSFMLFIAILTVRNSCDKDRSRPGAEDLQHCAPPSRQKGKGINERGHVRCTQACHVVPARCGPQGSVGPLDDLSIGPERHGVDGTELYLQYPSSDLKLRQGPLRRLGRPPVGEGRA